MTIADTGKTTWTEAAEAQESEVDFEVYPDYVVAMALVEQQKRTADALKRIAASQEQIAELLEHIAVKYLDARPVENKSAEASPDTVSELGW